MRIAIPQTLKCKKKVTGDLTVQVPYGDHSRKGVGTDECILQRKNVLMGTSLTLAVQEMTKATSPSRVSQFLFHLAEKGLAKMVPPSWSPTGDNTDNR